MVCLGCSAAIHDARTFLRCPSLSGMIQSRHSRRRVPISLSQSEFACGLRLGVVITLRPSRVSEASNSVEKIASWSWMMKRYS